MSIVYIDIGTFFFKPPWRSEWRDGLGIFVPRGTGTVPGVVGYLAWDWGQ